MWIHEAYITFPDWGRETLGIDSILYKCDRLYLSKRAPANKTTILTSSQMCNQTAKLPHTTSCQINVRDAQYLRINSPGRRQLQRFPNIRKSSILRAAQTRKPIQHTLFYASFRINSYSQNNFPRLPSLRGRITFRNYRWHNQRHSLRTVPTNLLVNCCWLSTTLYIPCTENWRCHGSGVVVGLSMRSVMDILALVNVSLRVSVLLVSTFPSLLHTRI